MFRRTFTCRITNLSYFSSRLHWLNITRRPLTCGNSNSAASTMYMHRTIDQLTQQSCLIWTTTKTTLHAQSSFHLDRHAHLMLCWYILSCMHCLSTPNRCVNTWANPDRRKHHSIHTYRVYTKEFCILAQ